MGFYKIDPRRVRHSLTAESPCAAGKTQFKGKCELGAFSYIGIGSTIQATSIGRYCSIAPNVSIAPVNHYPEFFTTSPFGYGGYGAFRGSEEFEELRGPVKIEPSDTTRIGHDVWIGAGAIIKRGVTVGDGAIIGAGAVVTKDVEPYDIVGGIPARSIRKRFEPALIERMIRFQWWNFDLSGLKERAVDFSKPGEVMDVLEFLKAEGKLKLLTPEIRVFSGSNPLSAAEEVTDGE